MTLNYGELLKAKRKEYVQAESAGTLRLANIGGATVKSRFIDEDESNGGIMGNRRKVQADPDQDDFLTQYFKNVYASNLTLKEQLSNSEEGSTTRAMTDPDGKPLDILNKGDDAINDYSSQVVTQEKLWNAIEFSESSGRPDAENTVEDGRKFVGKLQFGWARLQDYMRDEGGAFELDEFKDDEMLQDMVAEWHKKDIKNQIEKLENLPAGFNNKNGLTAVAHLGGLPGMKRFIKTKGKYNPHDGTKEKPGTYLSDYYAKFSKIK